MAARGPYLAEIGLVGRSPGLYNLYLGGAFDGTRHEQAVPRAMSAAMPSSPHWRRCSATTPNTAQPGERFGDYVIRAGHIRPTTAGNTFHADLAPELRS